MFWLCSEDWPYMVSNVGAAGYYSTTTDAYPIARFEIASFYACPSEMQKEILKKNVNEDNTKKRGLKQFEFSLSQMLDQLKLNDYYSMFIKQGFKDNDYWLLSKISDSQLKELGIKLIAHRLKILQYLKQY